MQQVKTYGCALDSLQATTITIELNLDKGSHRIISGLPDDAIKESLARIEAAVSNSGFRVPEAKCVYLLSPASLPKRGSLLDLPMAIALLAASGQLPARPRLKDFIICGELNLSGEIQPIRGALSIALHAWREKFSGVIVPAANVREAALVTKIPVYGVHSLEEAVQFICGQKLIEPVVINTRELFYNSQLDFDVDFCDVRSQPHAKRGLEVACAGFFGVLMYGPPGAGKSLCASRIPTILPPMTLQEALEITEIMSVFGDKEISNTGLISKRPFISCHNTTSTSGLTGGGTIVKPGLITYAHNGVLFLDEYAEFQRATIESLRVPIETGSVRITRAMQTVTFPASFMLVAATNPCPCGYFNHPSRSCSCSSKAIIKYLNRLSGPIMERLAIHLEVQPVDAEDLMGETTEEKSSVIRERVIRAREVQTARFKEYPAIHNNAQMNTALVKKFCKLEPEAEELLMSAIKHLKLSGRAFDSILKVALTIADLDTRKTKSKISYAHLSESIGYRNLDKEKWIASAESKDRKPFRSDNVFKIA